MTQDTISSINKINTTNVRIINETPNRNVPIGINIKKNIILTNTLKLFIAFSSGRLLIF